MNHNISFQRIFKSHAIKIGKQQVLSPGEETVQKGNSSKITQPFLKFKWSADKTIGFISRWQDLHYRWQDLHWEALKSLPGSDILQLKFNFTSALITLYVFPLFSSPLSLYLFFFLISYESKEVLQRQYVPPKKQKQKT